MLKLTAKEIAERDALIKNLNEARESIDNSLTDYNVIIESVRTFTQSVGERLREEYDSKSEKWQEENGDELVSTWEEFEANDAEIENDQLEHADALGGLDVE